MLVVGLVLLVSPPALAQLREPDGGASDGGLDLTVPAIDVWLPVYGPSVLKERPYAARHEGAVWTVTGTLRKGAVGGVAVIEISQMTGEILRLFHGK